MKRVFLLCVVIECALGATEARAEDFYVDPVVGSMSNDGSQEHPWRTLEEVLDSGLIYAQAALFRPHGERDDRGLRARSARCGRPRATDFTATRT